MDARFARNRTLAVASWTLSLALALSACEGSRSPVATRPSPRAATAGEPGSPQTAGPRAAASASEGEADSAPSSAERAVSRADRPGLGTEWGETRRSAVRHTSFVRANWGSPTALASIYYNDRQGAEATLRGGDRRFSEEPILIPGLDVTVAIVDANGRPLPSYSSGERTCVLGQAGDRYSIELRNRSSHRLEAVASVDGLDVLDGKAASFGKRGYVLDPGQTVTIDGWRRSDEHVAAFRFGAVRDSYAARTGSDRNVGVIGVALFHEQGVDPRWSDDEIHRRNTADPFPGQYASPPPPRAD